ncbi:MAG: hypothetical protein ACHP9Y_02115, partial [Gammaproteobacteria bacterium]
SESPQVSLDNNESSFAQHQYLEPEIHDELAKVKKEFLRLKTWKVNEKFSFNLTPDLEQKYPVFPFQAGGVAVYGVILLDENEISTAAKQQRLNVKAILQGEHYKKIVPLKIKGDNLEGFKKICYGGQNQGDMRIVGIELNKLLEKPEPSIPPLYVFALVKSHKDLDDLNNAERTLLHQLRKSFNKHVPVIAAAPDPVSISTRLSYSSRN